MFGGGLYWYDVIFWLTVKNLNFQYYAAVLPSFHCHCILLFKYAQIYGPGPTGERMQGIKSKKSDDLIPDLITMSQSMHQLCIIESTMMAALDMVKWKIRKKKEKDQNASSPTKRSRHFHRYTLAWLSGVVIGFSRVLIPVFWWLCWWICVVIASWGRCLHIPFSRSPHPTPAHHRIHHAHPFISSMAMSTSMFQKILLKIQSPQMIPCPIR